MKTCSKTVLLFAALSVSALSSGQTFAENGAMIGSNLIAYHGVETTAGASSQVPATAVAMIGANLIAYRGVETTAVASAEAAGSFCANTSTKRGHSNFNPGAIGLLSARSSC